MTYTKLTYTRHTFILACAAAALMLAQPAMAQPDKRNAQPAQSEKQLSEDEKYFREHGHRKRTQKPARTEHAQATRQQQEECDKGWKFWQKC